MNDLAKQPKVASVLTQYKVVLNVGEVNGVSVGDDYIIYRFGESIYDPDSGDLLGDYEEVIGKGTVTHVQEKVSTLESSEVKTSGRKVIRIYKNKRQPAWNSLVAQLGIHVDETPYEEVIEEPESVRPFSHAQVGDFAKRVD